MDVDEEHAAADDDGWRIAAAFVLLTLLAAGLFVLYVLAWDGGAHT